MVVGDRKRREEMAQRDEPARYPSSVSASRRRDAVVKPLGASRFRRHWTSLYYFCNL